MNQQQRSSNSPPGRNQRRTAGLPGRLSSLVARTLQSASAQLSGLLLIPWARTAMIVVAVFVTDCLTPLGIAAGALYMAAVLSALPIRHPRAVYFTASICSLLVLAGWLISPGQGQTEWWKVLTNRALDLGVIWAAAGMADAWNRLQQRRFKQVQEARLLHQATALSAPRVTFRKALENSLKTLCEILGWPAGHVYLRDSDGEHLLSRGIWWVSAPRFDLLRAAAGDLRFAKGEGVPGRIWEQGEPIAVADVAESTDYGWLKDPERLGVRSAFALPITVDGRTVAVMEFFSEEPIAVDFEFMPLARNMGQQLGRLFERQQADRWLRQSEERLRLALQGGGMGIWEWNLETGRVVWSAELERIHGLEPGAFQGTFDAVQQEIHPEDRERVARTVRQAVDDGGDYRVEYRIVRRDGAVRWMEGRGAIHADADGRPERMVGVCMDITERKEGEVRNARLAAIVDSSDDCILSKSPDGTILSWNRGAERMYGYTADEIVGRPISVLVPEGRPDDTRDIMGRINRGEHVDHYETLRQRKDGRLIDISLSVSPITDSHGNVVGASSVARDVTERKQAEEEMKEARERAETANRLRSRFLANMSHELRTPMNSVLGMLQLALGEDVPPDVRGWLATAKASGESLLLLLNDLLDLSKIDAGKLEIQPEPFSLRELVDVTARALAVTAFEKGIELLVDVEADVPDRITGDAGRLRQVLTNLVSNAVKFTDEGEVVLAVALDKKEADQAVVRFAVTDTGEGIPPEDQRRVFEPFIQSDAAASRRQGGAGLGLAIAGELVRRMGGDIEVESQQGRGSRFWFSLPLKIDAAFSPDEAAPLPTGSLQGVRVLVVDGNAASRELVVKVLGGWSMRPETAIDCDHAVGKLHRAETERRSYALVLADPVMPGVDAAALADRIAGAVAQPPPLILLRRFCGASANCSQTSSWSAYVDKPISPARLLEAVTRALGIAPLTAGSGGEPPCPKLAPGGLRVLVAEDTPASQEVAASALARRGHAVTVVENGREAVELLKEQGFDVVLMDVTMPVMDGYEATAAIREHEKRSGGRVPIIAMTAHATRGDHQRCVAAGMDVYMAKPIDVARLVEAVETAAAANCPPCALPAPEWPKAGNAGDQHPKPAAPLSDAPAETNGENGAVVIDYHAALERLGGDRELFRKIIALFDEDAPRLIQTAREAVGASDWPALARAAHSLKGLAANFGAENVVAPAWCLEEIGKSGSLGDAEQVIRQVQREVERLHDALAPYRGAPTAASAAPQA